MCDVNHIVPRNGRRSMDAIRRIVSSRDAASEGGSFARGRRPAFPRAGKLASPTGMGLEGFVHGLEGARDYALASRVLLRPSVEVGLRHDGEGAETGAVLDVGGGLVVSDSSTGLAVNLRVRMLVMHQAEGFRERAMAVSLSYNPTPSTLLGFTARVAPSWGGTRPRAAPRPLWGWALRLGGGQHSHGAGSLPVERASVARAFLTASSLHSSTAPIALWRTDFPCMPRYPSR